MCDSDKSFRENKLEKKLSLVKDGDGYNLDTVCRRGITGIIISIKYWMVRLGGKSFLKICWQNILIFWLLLLFILLLLLLLYF